MDLLIIFLFITVGIPILIDFFSSLSKEDTNTYIKQKPTQDISEPLVIEWDDEDSIIQRFLDKQDLLQRKKEYLLSIKWKVLRIQILERDSYQCQLCFSPDTLNVHHQTYENLFHEKEEDLITLCECCHAKLHKEQGYEYNKTYYI